MPTDQNVSGSSMIITVDYAFFFALTVTCNFTVTESRNYIPVEGFPRGIISQRLTWN